MIGDPYVEGQSKIARLDDGELALDGKNTILVSLSDSSSTDLSSTDLSSTDLSSKSVIDITGKHTAIRGNNYLAVTAKPAVQHLTVLNKTSDVNKLQQFSQLLLQRLSKGAQIERSYLIALDKASAQNNCILEALSNVQQCRQAVELQVQLLHRKQFDMRQKGIWCRSGFALLGKCFAKVTRWDKAMAELLAATDAQVTEQFFIEPSQLASKETTNHYQCTRCSKALTVSGYFMTNSTDILEYSYDCPVCGLIDYHMENNKLQNIEINRTLRLGEPLNLSFELLTDSIYQNIPYQCLIRFLDKGTGATLLAESYQLAPGMHNLTFNISSTVLTSDSHTFHLSCIGGLTINIARRLIECALPK